VTVTPTGSVQMPTADLKTPSVALQPPTGTQPIDLQGGIADQRVFLHPNAPPTLTPNVTTTLTSLGTSHGLVNGHDNYFTTWQVTTTTLDSNGSPTVTTQTVNCPNPVVNGAATNINVFCGTPPPPPPSPSDFTSRTPNFVGHH
jgi:hypothetical protein